MLPEYMRDSQRNIKVQMYNENTGEYKDLGAMQELTIKTEEDTPKRNTVAFWFSPLLSL